MRKRANAFFLVGAVVALQVALPVASLAADEAGRSSRQAGEDRWVVSLAITSGITAQEQHGSASSSLIEGNAQGVDRPPIPLQAPIEDDDTAVSPFVGGSLELMTPALPIPSRPRLFISGEILPTFGADRALAVDGDPDCIRGPEPGAPCATEEDGLTGNRPFDEQSVRGQGSKTEAKVDTLVFGASIGVSFPLQLGERQLRIKPSLGWINYEVDAKGLIVDAECPPNPNAFAVFCVPYTTLSPPRLIPGFLRETTLAANESKRFNGIGPGLDIEMDTGRFGPVGASVFIGARAYYILGDRRITWATNETFEDFFTTGRDVAFGDFEVKVDPWIYRAHLGIRFQWLGSHD